MIVTHGYIFTLSVLCSSIVAGEDNVVNSRTMFEELDDKLTRMLSQPKAEECKQVIKLIKLYQATIFRIEKMVKNNDMLMIKATQKVYDSGGPRFLQIKINDETFRRLGWSEEELDQYYNLRLITDQAWFELRQLLFS